MPYPDTSPSLSPSITIRPFSASDQTAIYTLLRDGVTENISPSFRGAVCSPGGLLRLLLIASVTSLFSAYKADILLLAEGIGSRPGRSVWVGCVRGKVVGSVAIMADSHFLPPSPHLCCLCSFYVDVSWRRLGVGQLLAQTALHHAWNAGYNKVHLGTFDTQRDALRLYRKLALGKVTNDILSICDLCLLVLIDFSVAVDTVGHYILLHLLSSPLTSTFWP
uniref:N-acetyltransferase domain-containing protein n=1 Tax=Callorhinchus milii TaxID=7868 RepID=A0A4W3J1Z0_CALMI